MYNASVPHHRDLGLHNVSPREADLPREQGELVVYYERLHLLSF